MHYKSLIISVSLITIFLIPHVSGAADVDVECENEECDVSTHEEPLFSEQNWIPGQSVTKRIEMKNNQDTSCPLFLTVTNTTPSSNNLSDALFVVIKQGEQEWYEDTLSSLYAEESVQLGTVAANQTAQYDWAITFDRKAGNEYQGINTTFDFTMGFECGSSDEEDGQVDSGTSDTEEGETIISPLVSGSTDELGTELTAAIGPEEDETEEKKAFIPTVLGLADSGVQNSAILLFVIGILIIVMAFAADRRARSRL